MTILKILYEIVSRCIKSRPASRPRASFDTNVYHPVVKSLGDSRCILSSVQVFSSILDHLVVHPTDRGWTNPGDFNGIFVGASRPLIYIWGELSHQHDSWDEPPSRYSQHPGATSTPGRRRRRVGVDPAVFFHLGSAARILGHQTWRHYVGPPSTIANLVYKWLDYGLLMFIILITIVGL